MHDPYHQAMIVSKLLPAAALLVGLTLAAPVASQPSAADPDEPGAAGAVPPAEPGLDARPSSPEEAAERRDEQLDILFARLAEAKSGEWKRLQSEIWRMWSDSGSPSMNLLLDRAEKALKEQDDPELALRFLDDLVRLAPDFAEGWNKRATVYFRLGEYGRAVADIERTLALEPRHFGALGGLGMILERLGDEKGAYTAYMRALEIHPNLPGAAKAVERLRPEVEGREL